MVFRTYFCNVFYVLFSILIFQIMFLEKIIKLKGKGKSFLKNSIKKCLLWLIKFISSRAKNFCVFFVEQCTFHGESDIYLSDIRQMAWESPRFVQPRSIRENLINFIPTYQVDFKNRKHFLELPHICK